MSVMVNTGDGDGAVGEIRVSDARYARHRHPAVHPNPRILNTAM